MSSVRSIVNATALVFLSRHPDGLYLYGNAMSSSQQDWRRAVVPPGSLLDDDATFKAAEYHLAEEWDRDDSPEHQGAPEDLSKLQDQLEVRQSNG
jgi:hypothetical protein